MSERIAEPRQSAPGDVAIVGVGCRLPGGITELDSLWTALLGGVDTTAEMSPERWAGWIETAGAADGRAASPEHGRRGAFLADIDRFDADFFGVSPREARQMDPQQRLLLEVAWSAMEDAGVPRQRWAGSRTGVYMGILAMDYTILHAKTLGIDGVDPYYASGKEFSFGAGRIAHTFGLHGPCIMLTTACSSSLMAVHLAAQALRAGDCDAALAGGVNLLMAPELSTFMGRIRALSPLGQCRPFDAAADGVVRGEGCAVVVLKRYADALADGDRILATVRGSATNHDGRSAGLTAPSAIAQESLLRDALSRAGIDPSAVDYVEAHSTGTPLGDPIELSALAAAVGRYRPADRPLLIGSHKANFGHLDSAAGILGLLKALLVVRHGVVPPQIKLSRLNPQFDWAGSGIAVPTAPTALDHPGAHVAGVSAFGLSGSNVHILLGSAPVVDGAPREEPTGAVSAEPAVPVLLLSGPTQAALQAQVSAYRQVLSDDADNLDDLLYSAAVRRTHHVHRLAVVGADRTGLTAALAAYVAGEPLPGTVSADLTDQRDLPVVHVFSGQGSQWPRMGLDLYRDKAVVRRTLDECDAMIRAERAWSLLDELRREPSRLTSTEYAQPAIFAVQLALSRLWAEWGVVPDTVIGHSMGEVAAACVAGALDVGDAIRLILHRGRVMQEATGSGRMVSVQLSATQAAAALSRHPQITIATVNGPGSVVISGPAAAIAEAVADLRGGGVSCVPLEVDYAFHSPAVHRHGDELAELLADFPGGTAGGRMVSTVDPDCADPVFDGAYWGRNVRDQVRLWPAVDRVLARGPAVFVEVGVHPVLNRALRDALAHRDRVGVVVSSLARGRPARSTMSQALAELHVAGVPIDWAAVYEAPRPYIPLPPVQLAGERHWLSKPVGRTARAAAGTAGPAVAVPALPAAAATSPEPAAPVPAVPVAAAAAPQPAAPQPAAPQPAALGQTAPWVAAGVASPQPDDGRAQGRERVAWVITGAVAEVLGYPAQRRIPRARGFYDLGMDSLTLVNFAARLGESLGCAVGPEVALEFPTIDQLTDHLVATLPVRPADAHEIDSVPGVDPVESGHRADVVDPGNRSTVDAAAQPRSAPVTASPASGSEPIAIIGMGCRLPGAEGLAAYWRLLCGAVDATSDIPGTRWDAGAMLATGPVTPGTVVTRRGAFLDQVDQFDNGFFQISAREARAMDPQQRIFLEVAWEALEDAGVDVAALRGGRTGLFVGLNSTDYQQLVTRNATDVDLYYGTGNSFSGAAGRLSYFLGVRGPSLAVDTACSSSLVAVHLAGRSLACGESEVAVVGGVNIMVTPTVFLAMSAGGALAPDGRCKTFDDAADGYGRGEGAGVVVLKTLARARADGDRVYAVIHGSAVNHNGASGGLTVPSLEAQVDVVRDALHGSGINPADVDYVEAHGTGTRLGDAIELTGLARAFGPGRADDQPLLVGSVKTNIGHLEAAAGVAGLIKTALAIRYGRIPGQLHTSQPTRQVDWDRLPLRIAVGNRPWPSTGRRVAGVSAFGFTGTNAHVVLAEPEREPEREPVPGPVSDSDPTWSTRPHLLVASARTAAALDATAARLRERLADSVEVEVATAGAGIAGRSDLADAGSAGQGGDLADVCYSAGARRSHLEHRLAVVGRTRLSLLDDLSPGPSGSGVRRAMVAWDEERPLVLVFGDRVIDLPWHRLGREEPALRRSLEAFSQVARELVGRSPDTELHAGAGPGGSGADDPLNVVAAQIALTALWRDYGIVADAAAGYGIGEIAAAHAAGLLDDRAAVLAATGPSGSARPTELVGPTRAALPLYRSGFGVSKAAAPARIAADLIDDGRTTLLDVGLAGAAEPVVRTAPEAFAVLDDGSTHDRPGCFMHVVASAYLRGCSLNWHRLYPPASRRVVSLPNYPWQRRRHWIDRTAPPFTAPRAADRAGQRAPAGAPVTTTATGDAPGVRSMTSLVAELHTLAAEQLEDRLLAFVLGGAADALGEPDGEIDPDKGFFELGMDSVMSVSLKGHVEQALGLELPATLAFDFPNARSLTRHLVAELTVVDGSNVDNGRSAPPAAAPEAVAPDDFDELSDDDLMSRLAASLASSESLLGGKG